MRRGRGLRQWQRTPQAPRERQAGGGEGGKQGRVTGRWKGLAGWGIDQGIGLFEQANGRMRDAR